MKQLNTPCGLALLALMTVYVLLHNLAPALDESRVLLSGLVLATLVGVLRYITRPDATPSKTHADLPMEAMHELRESLHHSQMTLYLNIMQPMLAARFPELIGDVIGKKLNEAPLTRFDEKIMLMKQAFKKLGDGRVLYVKRAYEDRDRALTMLVFLRLLWQEKPTSSLPTLLDTIPVALYPMLRGEVHRLFDVLPLFTDGCLRVNEANSNALSGLIGFYSNPATHTPVTEDISPGKEQETELNAPQAAPADEALEKSIESTADCLPDFINWLGKRISSGNKQFSLESQELVLCNSAQFDEYTVFVVPDVRAKYQSRSGVAIDVLERTLRAAFPVNQTWQIEREGVRMDVLPCRLAEAFTTNCSTLIMEGSEK